jgi:hypothetical protein
MAHILTFYQKKNLYQKKFQQHVLGSTIGGIHFYCQLPVPIKTPRLWYKRFRKLLVIPCLWILYVRSFFIKDRTSIIVLYVLPMITCVFIFLANMFPDIFNGFSAFYFQMYLGSQLLIYDEIGSRISYNLYNHADPILSQQHMQPFLQHRNIIVRHMSFVSISNVIIGKTAMTATGRATLVVGAFTGSAWLYNSYREREAADLRSQADREAANQRAQQDREARIFAAAKAAREAAKIRAYQNYQDARRRYDNRRFYSKETKPQWDEDAWKDWRKSK